MSAKPTFEFIVYIWHELRRWLYYGNMERIEDKVNRLVSRIDERPDDSMELDIKVGGKHFKFSNKKFIKSVIALFLNFKSDSGDYVETIYPTKREIDYILICTLLRNLPIKHKNRKKVRSVRQREISDYLCFGLRVSLTIEKATTQQISVQKRTTSLLTS